MSARPYALKLMDVLHHLSARCNHDAHPLLDNRDGNRWLILAVTADRGLCGGFNGSITKKAIQVINNNSDKEIQLITAGKKGTLDLRIKKTKSCMTIQGGRAISIISRQQK